MKRIELCLMAAEGLFWVGLVALVLCLTALIGCGEGNNPIAPEGNGVETVGDLKSDTETNDGKNLVIVKTIGAEGGIPMAPSVVKVVKAGDLRVVISLSHEGAGDGGEIVAIKATEGDLIDGDKIRVYADGNYLGRVRIESDTPLSEIHILIEDDDLPSGEVLVEIEISRNGTEVAEAEIEIENAVATSPAFESMKVGDFPDEIVLSFSDVVNAYRSIKNNIDIVLDGTRLPIRTYEEDGTEVVLIMRKDLVPGTYTVSYKGDGGLEDLDGEEVPAFEADLTVEDESAQTPATAAPAVWKTIPHGIYGSGAHVLIALDAFGYKVSPWTRQILSSKRFETEDEPGHTELYRVTPEDLGLTGTYTVADVLLEAVAQGYRLVPEETAAQLRLLYANQPEGELVAVISAPMLLEQSTYVLALGGGSAQYPGKWLIAVNMTAELSAEYTAFILTK